MSEIKKSNSSIDQETIKSEEEKTIHQSSADGEDQGYYPVLLESAPFPALGSVDEISQTISRIKSNATQRSYNDSTKNEKYELEEEEKVRGGFQQEAYHTEGLRNPGWLTVISCFLVNFFVFGTTFTWGNYQKLYLEDIYAGKTSTFKISFVGTSASALLLAMGVFITPVIQKIGFRGAMSIGTIFSPLGLILASFSNELWHIYLSQGILFGLGSAFVFSPSVTLPSQWFTRRRALATGIAVSGSGIGGVCLSPMIQNLIDSIGYRNTLRVQGSFGFVLLCIATSLATSRYRPPPTYSKDGVESKWYHMFDRNLLSGKFVLILLFGFFVTFGYVAPFFLTPQYVTRLGEDASAGAAMISVMSATNAICRISLGYLADRVGRFNTMFGCTFLAGFFTMVIWQFATSYGIFILYCVLYGLTAGGFVSLLPVVTADIVGVENIQKGLGMAYLITVVGNLLGTPIIGSLLSAYGWTASIQFAGSMTVVASLFMLALRFVVSEGRVFAKI